MSPERQETKRYDLLEPATLFPGDIHDPFSVPDVFLLQGGLKGPWIGVQSGICVLFVANIVDSVCTY